MRIRARLTSAAVALAWLFTAAPSSAFRPLTVDDAAPADFQTLEIKPGVQHTEDVSKDRELVAEVELSYGLVPDLEVSIKGTYLFADPESGASIDGFGDAEISAKWRVLRENERGWVPALAIAPSVKLPTADTDRGLGNGGVDVGLTAILSKSLGPVGLHLNAGYTFTGRESFQGAELRDTYFYGGALEVPLLEPVNLVGDVFVEQVEVEGERNTVAFTAGLTLALGKALTLDAAIQRRLRAIVGPDIAVIAGFTYAW